MTPGHRTAGMAVCLAGHLAGQAEVSWRIRSSYIRKEKYRPATTTSPAATAVSHSGYHP